MRIGIQIAVSLLGGLSLAFVTIGYNLRIHPDFLTDDARMRLDTLSFYGVLLMVISFGVMVVWNCFGKMMRRLPRLAFGRTMTMVGLLGVLFWAMTWLVMGALAERMPEAWGPRWAAEWMREDRVRHVPAMAERREAMEQFREVVWAHAAEHGGHPPGSPFADGQELGMWRFPAGGFYVAVPGAKPGVGNDILMVEPATAGTTRWVLMADGRVESLPGNELQDRVKAQLEKTVP